VHCNLVFSLIHPHSVEQTLHYMKESALVMTQEQQLAIENEASDSGGSGCYRAQRNRQEERARAANLQPPFQSCTQNQKASLVTEGTSVHFCPCKAKEASYSAVQYQLG